MHTTIFNTLYSLLLELRKISSIVVISLVFLILFLAGSCMPSEDASKGGSNRLIAKVFNKSLFQSDLDALVGPDASKDDSSQIANAYIEKWIRESVMMNEAEKYVPKDLNIDELVRDYRASLIRHNYEMLLVETQLDSTINETELNAHYQEHKEQYKLKNHILKCRFIKLPKTAEGFDDVKDWWKSDDDDDFKRLLDYSSRYAEVYMLNDDLWYYLDDVSQYLPKSKLTSSNYKSKKEINTDDDNYEYLLKILETVPANEYAPLDFVREQASKFILHKRKIKLLEDKKEEMYERESGTNNVKVYVN